jgi:IS5 family transposase
MIQRFLFCSRGKHSRMRRHARRRGEDYVSQCRWCGTSLVRNEAGDWISRDRWEKQNAAAED